MTVLTEYQHNDAKEDAKQYRPAKLSIEHGEPPPSLVPGAAFGPRGEKPLWWGGTPHTCGPLAHTHSPCQQISATSAIGWKPTHDQTRTPWHRTNMEEAEERKGGARSVFRDRPRETRTYTVSLLHFGRHALSIGCILAPRDYELGIAPMSV